MLNYGYPFLTVKISVADIMCNIVKKAVVWVEMKDHHVPNIFGKFDPQKSYLNYQPHAHVHVFLSVLITHCAVSHSG